VHAHAEQPNGAVAGFGALEQGERAPRDVVRVPCRRSRRVAPRDGREIVVADLDRDRPAAEKLAFEPGCGVARHLINLAADVLEAGQILGERVFGSR
jgi:hypothetical protein